MNIILGATGQVGAAIVDFLIEKNLDVKAVIRDAKKARVLKEKGVKVAIADYFHLDALKDALNDGDLIFLLTPETMQSNDVLGDSKQMLENYRKAIESSGIKSIIGLSSGGAQHEKYEWDTGNLLMSDMLEHEFLSLPVNQVFVRPSYFYSNWLMSVDMVKETGILPTFFPSDLKIDMNSPRDVAEFISNKIYEGVDKSELIELTGPKQYSSNDVADEIEKVLGREVKVQEIPREEWYNTMKNVGFSDDAAKNFVKMTEFVADGNAELEGKGSNPIELKTSLNQYFKENIK
ncbi:NmrA family NAD(P)-binding protein [Rhodohalobacter sp. 614A]|uniref:NmrA family NAD(P)-binding protein n=1 Tax=Rhodohalobacter sp. 614A TaxID=2908649 RepID=UPI001F41DE67|nr:NmrA family NAD(P)-binding protein [Rhodohalobacter sp. 614A]